MLIVFIYRSLLVFERLTSQFIHFDSCNGLNNGAAHLLSKRLSPFLCGKWPVN